MKKKYFIPAILFLFAGYLSASDFTFSLTPEYNLENGVLNEYVLYDDSDGNRQKLSELNWNIENSSSIGLDAGVNYKSYELSFSLAASIPGVSGLMYDSDWQNEADTTMKTNYSISTNTINSASALNLEFGKAFNPSGWFKIKPFAQFSYDYINFSSSDSEGWYGDADTMSKFYGYEGSVSYDDEKAKHFVVGDLCSIDYLRNTYNLYLGLETIFSPVKYISVFAGFAAAPLTYVSSVDTHWQNSAKTFGVMYNDRMFGYFKCFKASAGAEFNPLNFLTIGINCDYTFIRTILGNTYAKTTRTSTYPNQPASGSYAGCSGYTLNASLYAKITL